MVNLAASTISEPSKWLNLDEKLAGKTKQNLSMVQLANCTADFSRCFFYHILRLHIVSVLSYSDFSTFKFNILTILQINSQKAA